MRRAAVWLLVGFALATAARAHRLDEYLQAARIGLHLERLDLTLDLTPGVDVAAQVLNAIDPLKHPTVLHGEAANYSRCVLKALHLDLDGAPQELQLVRTHFPSRAEMEAGEGTIRLQATVRVWKLQTGAHVLHYRNDHLPKISVYLVNALVPEDHAIRITRQERDERQQDYRLFFEVLTPAPPPR